MTQDEALNILKMGHSVFLTGAAGTGKTFVLNKYLNYLKSHSIYPAITASTGIAATHIGGQTIHSWGGIGIYEKLDRWTLDKLEQNEKLYKKYSEVKVLVIDEISMLHASRLDMINTLFKKFRKSSLPFGGIQIIFCGDFFQLPPVVKRFNTEEIIDDSREFAYNSLAWKELNPVICYLEENYRQEDESLTKILNDIRFERNIENVFEILNNKVSGFEREIDINTNEENFEKDILKLYTHNIDVDNININKYISLASKEEYSYEMQSSGKKNLIEALKNNCLAPEILNLKIGTKVIFVKNDKNKEYQNGTLGEVIDFDITNMPIVKSFSGKEINVSLETWQHTNDDGKIMAEISQIPLRYAWAITIHKSQGMTLDTASIDLSKAFGSGMGYVALSRVRKFENIKLIGIHTDALKINKSVIVQDKVFIEKSKRAEMALEKYLDNNANPKKELIKKQEDFILNCDGDLLEHEIIEEKYEKKEKIKTSIITLDFLKNKLLPNEIAEKRDLKTQTIITHIEELLEARDINIKDIEYIIKNVEKNYNKKDLEIIKKVLNKDIGLKAKRDELKDKYKIKIDYDSLKILSLK